MKFKVHTFITPKAAARLLITDDIDLNDSWPREQAILVLNELCAIPIKELLDIVDNTEDRIFDSSTIPQFGNIDALINVPLQMMELGIQCLSYAELGFRLKNDINATLEANTKYGENHGKGAALIGIANCTDTKITCSALSCGFCAVEDANIQKEIVIKLYFRIPIVQEILKHAAKGKYNGYDSMTMLMQSTKERRGQCLRKIFKSMSSINDSELNARLNNIEWIIEKEE